MSDSRFTQIERMLTELIHSVGTLKAVFEEEREENQRRFEQLEARFERRFEQMEARFDKRFDGLSEKFAKIGKDQRYMFSRILDNESEIQKLKDTLYEQGIG